MVLSELLPVPQLSSSQTETLTSKHQFPIYTSTQTLTLVRADLSVHICLL